MVPRYLILVPALILAVFLIAACSDNDPTAPAEEPGTLLTLNLGEYFLEAFATEGIVFASDQQGHLLDLATWSGPATIVLKNSTNSPDTISFTFVQSNAWELVFATELGVPRGTVRDFPGQLRTTETGEADITFLNPPDCERYLIADNWGTVSGPGPLESPRTIHIYGDSTDCFVRVDQQGLAPVGGWLRGLKSGSSDTLDFDRPGSVSPLAGTTVQIPPGGERLSCNLYGNVVSGSSRSIISFEWLSFDGNVPESVVLYQPPFSPADLGTAFYLATGGSPTAFYTQESTGPIPPLFTKMAGDLTVVSASPDSLAFTTTSDWDRSVISWYQQGGLYATWYCEGPSSVQAFALPDIPDYVSNLYPDFPRAGFTLNHLEIIQDTAGGMTRSQGRNF